MHFQLHPICGKLKDKEPYLATYSHMFETNCMDSSMTTSPVESQNNIVHNKLGVTLNLNAYKGVMI